MKNLRKGEFKAFWENDKCIKLAAWLWTPQPRETNKPVWCLCYDGFSEGRNECPLIKDNFTSFAECVAYGETITKRRR